MSFRSIIHDMVIDMNETRLNTVAQLRAFLKGTRYSSKAGSGCRTMSRSQLKV